MKPSALPRALRYFTIVPIPGAAGDETGPGPGEIAWLPLVGAAVGFAAGTLARLQVPATGRDVATACAFGWPLLLTGALHYDGFLDACDAAFAPVSPERRLEIAKDPRHGTFAVCGAALHASVTLAALGKTSPERWPTALALAEASARLATLLFATSNARSRQTRAQPATAARAFERPPDRMALAVQSAAVLIWSYAEAKRRGLFATFASATFVAIAARFLRRRFGALNGDAYGALIVAGSTVWLAIGTTEA